MKKIAGFLLAMVLVSFQGSLGQDKQGHWLIGRWEGNLEGFTGQSGPARTFRVTAVSPDGSARGMWYVTGRKPFPAEIRVEASHIRVVTVAKSVVELTREGDDVLIGKFALTDGRAWPIKLARIRPSTEFDGQWSGSATPADSACRQGTYALTIKDSQITGIVEFHSNERGGTSLRSKVTGEVNPDKTAALSLVAIDPNSRTTRFSGTFTGTEFRGTDAAPRTRCHYEVSLKRK